MTPRTDRGDEDETLASVRLARSPWRMLALPSATALVVIIVGLTGLREGGIAGIAAVALAPVALAGAAAAAAVLLSVRLDVEEAALRLRWLGGERRYHLVRGAITRVALRGPSRSRLRARLSAFGWALGPARLRDEETIEVVRLAPTPAAILVPTDRGRLLVAPASEQELLTALSAAAEVRQRLDRVADEVTSRLPAPPPPAPPAAAALPPAPPATLAPPPPPVAPSPEPPAEPPTPVLTGIERQLLEERLADRAAGLPTVETAPRPAVEAPPPPAMAPAPPPPLPLPVPVLAPPVERRRRERRRSTWTRPVWMPVVPRPGTWFAAFAAPVCGGGLLWLIAPFGGTVAGREAAQLLALTLILAGPSATLAGLAARFWWPRLAGLVLAGGIFALLIAGRALLN